MFQFLSLYFTFSHIPLIYSRFAIVSLVDIFKCTFQFLALLNNSMKSNVKYYKNPVCCLVPIGSDYSTNTVPIPWHSIYFFFGQSRTLQMKMRMYIHQIHSRRNCSKSGSKSCRFNKKVIILLWLVISVLSRSLENYPGIKTNPGPLLFSLNQMNSHYFVT